MPLTARKEVADTSKHLARFDRTAHLLFKHVIKRDLPLQGIMQVETIHANEAAATAISRKAVLSEATITDKQTTCPIYSCPKFSLEV